MNKVKWFVPGDIDGLFGLMLDNLIQLLVLVGLCIGVCGFPAEFVFKVILPGVACSLVVGNVFYSWQAAKLAEKEGRSDVTALPYGINTVSMFAFIFFVMMPVYMSTKDYKLAWKVGLLACFLSGLIEVAGSFIADFIRKHTPRAAMLSALCGIAITFISMDFFIKTFQRPILAFLPLAVILIQYFGRVRLPFGMPAGLASVIIGSAIAWSMGIWSKPMMNPQAVSDSFSFLGFHFPVISIADLFSVMNQESIKEYAAVIIPMGVANVIGSLQNIESAEAAGDRFDTRNSLLVNGIGTVAGSFLGSPFPTTIYIGHPGWKALGARIGYSVLNGAVMSLIGFFGFMSLISAVVPIEAGMAIILWIGIIIGAQAFETSPIKHAPAIVLGIFPALAGWGVLLIQSIFNFANGKLGEILAKENITNKYAIVMSDLSPDMMLLPPFSYPLHAMLALNQGFLLVSMFWAAICVAVLERQFIKAGHWCLITSFFSAIGMIHSYRLLGNGIANNFSFPASGEFTVAYVLMGGVFYLTSVLARNQDELSSH